MTTLLRLCLVLALVACEAAGDVGAAPIALEPAPPPATLPGPADGRVTTITAGWAATTNNTSTDDATALRADYDPLDWSGGLQAWPLDRRGAEFGAQPLWDAARQLDAADPGARVVVSHDGTAGHALRWEALSAARRALLSGADGESAGRMRLDWLRGSHNHEAANGGPLRNRLRRLDGRPFRLGAIVRSQPWYTGPPAGRRPEADFGAWRKQPAVAGRPAMVYVAANDGMLHGFDARDATERLAFLPAGGLEAAVASSRPAAPRRYLLDGPVFTGDAGIGSRGAGTGRPSAQTTDWTTVLTGTGGAGLRGYYLLDAGRPDRFTESTAGALVLLDTTARPDDALGHILSPPARDAGSGAAAQITKLNDGRWAVLLGNGVNSPSDMPVLLIQYLDGARERRDIAPDCPAPPAACAYRGGNGLSAPMPVDMDGDGRADVAYAGDLLGHLWKFDLGAQDPALWKLDFSGAPLFTARDDAGRLQAISTAPAWLTHPRGGLLLTFGTGRMLSAADRTDLRPQSVYGIHDEPSAGPVNRPSERRRPATLAVVRITGAPGARSRRSEVDRSSVNAGTVRGWRMDLPAPGERVLESPSAIGGRQWLFTSSAGSRDYFTVLDAITGDAPAQSFILAPLPGEAAADRGDNRVEVASTHRMPLRHGAEWRLLPPPGSSKEAVRLRRGASRALRTGWRQLR